MKQSLYEDSDYQIKPSVLHIQLFVQHYLKSIYSLKTFKGFIMMDRTIVIWTFITLIIYSSGTLFPGIFKLISLLDKYKTHHFP